MLVTFMVALSYVLGSRRYSLGKDYPYESGINPTGSARIRFNVKYYLVGIFFVLFDVEAAIIFAWAVSFRELGWPGFIEVLLFIDTLALGLVYVWKLGGLDWYRPAQTIRTVTNNSRRDATR